MRLIDVDALIDDCKKYLNSLNPSRDGKECTRIHWLIGILSNAPTIEERKTGKWIGYNIEKDGWKRTDGSPVFMRCSECNKIVLNNGSVHWNFCPNCGAKMDGGE